MEDNKIIEMTSKIIFGKTYKDKLDQKILNNKILWLFIMILFFWNCFNTYGFLALRDTNHVKLELPAINYHNGSIIAGNDFANDAYYMSWGMYDIITHFSHLDKKNIEYNLSKIANKMTETDYLKKRAQIEQFIAIFKENSLRTNFIIPSDGWTIKKEEELNTYGKEVYTVTAKGNIEKSFGGSYSDKPKECSIDIQYFRKGGVLYVQNYSSNCF